MAELRTETRLIADLQAHPQNYRAHPPEQISAIKASLTRLGQFRAVVVNTEDTILAGHGVVQAAQELGWTEITVCRVAQRTTSIA
jgi:ParB-like chromosome segregation protein Spo0J